MTNKPLLVGVTGGIGSGKSIICAIFQTLGIQVYAADDRAKLLMSNDSRLRRMIVSKFGKEAFKGSILNRKYLADKVFNNHSELQKLNNLVHPAVAKDFNEWAAKISGPIAIKEAALLFETGSYNELDKTILVTAPEKLRISRVLLRDQHRNKSGIEDIINVQWPDAKKRLLADFVILNDEKKMIIPQTLHIYEELINLRR